ncbi:fumarylacetoacetate hydrolase family protein [Beijerinckia sp. L45]|uniref:fumarylacetoacetate hydrolase family protein n=1 Tax=Beijerinckia sp. L45 TaxID=1641855 RepID=UPI001FEDE3DE|nr:fumarylacetoacetate hydrolase family protein [Beijerinckia sp. L45]
MQNRRRFLTATAGLAGVASMPLAAVAAETGAAPRLALPALPVPTLPIVGSDAKFQVRRIYCIGRNYLAHVEELNHDRSQPPLFFQKARDMIVQSGEPVTFPSLTHDYEHEIELVLAMKSGGMNIPVEHALDHVYGYAVGLDMTRRDLQNAAQEKRQPWESGKSFEQSAPCSAITPVSASGHISAGTIVLTVNNKVVTEGNLKDMIWNTAEIIAHLSTAFGLAAGDLIYTGTPKGVGKVNPGDVMVAKIEGLSELRTPIVA